MLHSKNKSIKWKKEVGNSSQKWTNLNPQTFRNPSQAPAQDHALSHKPPVLYLGTRIVLDIHGLVLCLDIDPFLYLYNTYHEDHHEGILSNEAMNEHCAVYYVLNEAVNEN